MRYIYLIGLLCLGFSIAQSQAQGTAENKHTFRGNVFGDYYWITNHHNPNLENQNGFWFRRIYLTHEYTFSDAFSSRVRLEMNSAGDFESSTEMIPDVKDAYLKWQNNRHQILAGISSTPTWGLVEDVWGYRSVEKSPLDLYDLGSSRDFGLSFKGKIDQAEKLNYHFFIGNGNSNRPEVDKGKKVMFSLAYNITDQLIIEAYSDWNDTAGESDSYTAQAFAGYQSDRFNLGALYAYQYRELLDGASHLNLDLASLFSNFTLNNEETLKVYIRADHLFDSYAGGSGNSYIPFAEGVESTFVVGGVDILLHDQIHIMPNIESIFYGENAAGLTPSTDIIPRMTVFYEF